MKYIVVQMRAGLSLSHSLLAKDLQATCVFWKAPGGPWSPAGGGHYWEWTQAQTAVSSTFLSLVLIISAVAQSCLPLQPRGLQHSRLPCPSPTPGASSNSCPLVMPSNHLILYHPLLLLPSIFPSIRVFSNESVLPIRWPKYWSFSFSMSPSNEYSGLISFRVDWFDLLAVQGTLKSLLQNHI